MPKPPIGSGEPGSRLRRTRPGRAPAAGPAVGPPPRPADRTFRGGSVRDRIADVCYAAVAATLGILFVVSNLNERPPVPTPPLPREVVIGVLACAGMLLLRRRWPAGLAAGLVVAGMLSVAASAAVFPAVFNVAVRRSWPVTAGVAGLHAGWAIGFLGRVDMTTQQHRASIVFVLLLDATLIASGKLVRSQHLLVGSLRERAGQAEEEQRLRIEEARRLERERIAREMHDVLAHRISLLAMHAGALEFRPDAPAEQVSRAAEVVRSCALEAQEDLREVIGVLREDAGARLDAERPQPTLADLPELVGDSRRTGTPVSLDNGLGDLGAVPAGVGRHAYRIVQEGLTNARKHAPGAEVRVVVAGAPGTGLTVELRNRLAPGTGAAEIPGAGAGLIGLRERADLIGGRLEHGRTLDGDFRLWSSLPWPA